MTFLALLLFITLYVWWRARRRAGAGAPLPSRAHAAFRGPDTF